MDLRPFDSSQDYPLVAQWWTSQDCPIPALSLLSDIGVMVTDDDGVDIVAAWMYTTNSTMCWLEWLIGNPEVSWEVRGEAIDLLIDGFHMKALKEGRQLIMITAKHSRVIERLQAHGYTKNTEGMTNLNLLLNNHGGA